MEMRDGSPSMARVSCPQLQAARRVVVWHGRGSKPQLIDAASIVARLQVRGHPTLRASGAGMTSA